MRRADPMPPDADEDAIIYTPTDEDIAASYRRVHANGEQTHVVLVSVLGRDYAAVAFDVDPRDMSPGAAECIAHDPTIEGVYERAARWMDQHPKGVAYDGGGSSGGSKVLAFIKRAAAKLNEYGNEQMGEMQQRGQQ